MLPFRYLLVALLYYSSIGVFAQDITLYKQFNGQFDYTAFGNTMNLEENSSFSICDILTSSSADFYLDPNHEIVAAYLYWAGSGPGDFEITFDQNPIIAERRFNYIFTSGGSQYIYFAAFADITNQLQNSGNGNYTLSDLDLTNIIPAYCSPPGTGTNFGGWAVTVIYKDENLPYNQVNVFDGLEGVHQTNQNLTLQLDNLMISDTSGAKIGFLAWEGDREIAVNETLRINGNILSNPPLNPANNAFNGTNSFTGSDELYNMDIDFYYISNYIGIGDTSAEIRLTSGQDFVMINNIITVLNTALPDATISIDNIGTPNECGDRELSIEYTVYNHEATAELPAGTPIAFYVDEELVAQSATLQVIPIDGEESNNITFTLPSNTLADFTLKVVVDDIGDSSGIIQELDEDNNEDETQLHILINPIVTGIADIEACEVIGTVYFDLTQATAQLDPSYDVNFYITADDAENNRNPIDNPESYVNTENPQTIYVRVANVDCFLVESFKIEVVFCPLPDATIDFPEVTACRGRNLLLPYTIYNMEATGELMAGVSIAFYHEARVIAMSKTRKIIPIDGSEDGVVEIFLPEDLPNIFNLTASVDDDGHGNGVIEEMRKDNNSFTGSISFKSIPPIPNLPDLSLCDEGFNTAVFNLSLQDDLITQNSDSTIDYYTSLENAISAENPIENPQQYSNISDPQTIYVRLENKICFTTTSFLLKTEPCKPFIPQGFSPNGDGKNDVFEISNLLNIYINFELHIYSRNGNLIHSGYNNDGFWDGITTRGFLYEGHLVPVGTYYYVLNLNDAKYPDAFIGWIYVNY